MIIITPPRGCISSGQDHERGNVIWATQWKVEKELRDSGGLAWVRRYLSRFDYLDLQWITLRRSPGRYDRWENPNPIFGKCSALASVGHPQGTSSGFYRIYCNVRPSVRYPALAWVAEEPSSRKRPTYLLNDMHESVVAIIAHEVSHYLGWTDQVPANGRVLSDGLKSTSEFESDEFMKAAVEAYRRRDDELPGTFEHARWCVVCGKVLSKGGGSQCFCSDRCRSTYHNRLRGARIAARRGENVCEVCGKKFRPARSDARTCSPKCRQRKYRKDRTGHNSSSAQLLKNA